MWTVRKQQDEFFLLEKELTQKQLAEKLNITDRAVSNGKEA